MAHSHLTLFRNADAWGFKQETYFQMPFKLLLKQWLDFVFIIVHKNSISKFQVMM